MTGAAIVLAFTSALCFGVALVLTHIGLRYIPPLPGAAISIPSSTLLFIAISPIVLGGRPIVWAALKKSRNSTPLSTNRLAPYSECHNADECPVLRQEQTQIGRCV